MCPVGGLVGGCGARAVSRKTPIYFIIHKSFVYFVMPSFTCIYITFTCNCLCFPQNLPWKPSLQNDVKWLTNIMSRCGVGGRVLGDGGGRGAWWWVLGTNRGAGVLGPPCCRRRPSTPHLTLAPQVSIPLFAPSIFGIWPRLCQLVLTSAGPRTLFATDNRIIGTSYVPIP